MRSVVSIIEGAVASSHTNGARRAVVDPSPESPLLLDGDLRCKDTLRKIVTRFQGQVGIVMQ